MLEIAPQYHQPIARILVVVVTAAVIALMLLRSVDAPRRRGVLARAAIVGIVGAVASVVLYTSRDAGTGTQTAWGWPRVVVSLWQSWETGQRSHGIRWRGLIENAAFYGTITAAIGALLVRRRDAARAPGGR